MEPGNKIYEKYFNTCIHTFVFLISGSYFYECFLTPGRRMLGQDSGSAFVPHVSSNKTIRASDG